MFIDLKDTSASEIRSRLDIAHREVGQSASVFTLLVINDGGSPAELLKSCVQAGREHPSRIILISTAARQAANLNAEIHLGEEIPGEVITLQFKTTARQLAPSVILPLLLADSPVIAWWPVCAPENLATDDIGSLASRRITDAKAAKAPLTALRNRQQHYQPGDTDLSWTRATQWRTLLAASLDQHAKPVTQAEIRAEADNPTAALLAAWLENRLRCGVKIINSTGPGLTQVKLTTETGDILITRLTGFLAKYEIPGLPARQVALRRPTNVNHLITEELRLLDTDNTYTETLQALGRRFEVDAKAKRATR